MRIFPTLAYVAAWAVPWRPYTKVRAEKSGLVFHVHRRCVAARHISKYGAIEPDLTNWLSRHLSSCAPGLFVDAGANIGWHSLHAARMPGAEQVVAFEADPVNAWLFECGRSENGIGNVILVPLALGAQRGTARLNKYKASNTGRHSIAADHGMGSITVPIVDLDGALDDLGLGDKPVSVVKIDVEGFEPAVIAGAKRTLAKAQVLSIELSPALYRAPHSLDDVAGALRSYGFAPFVVHADGVSPVEVREIAARGVVDTLWLRS